MKFLVIGIKSYMKDKKYFMKIALEEAKKGMLNGEGGPFGAIIVKDGEIISKAHNEVLKTNDPTAHAEIVAIRKASKKLGRFNLSDCEIYSTCEPCPMCFSAIHWAKIKKLYFVCSRKDAAEIGFDDNYIYEVIKGKIKDEKLKSEKIEEDSCYKLFNEWKEKPDKIEY